MRNVNFTHNCSSPVNKQIYNYIGGAFNTLIRRSALLLSVLLLCATATHAQARTPVNVILDTDMASDVDDAGVVVTLLSMEDLGEANILAIGVCVLNDWSILAVDAFITYYGRPDIPLGTAKTGYSSSSRYAQQIAEKFPRTRNWNSAADAPEVIGVYRQVLAQQPDNSVTFVSVGPKTNLAKLLQSDPDEYSDLNGRDLVAKKVKRWVAMAGNSREYNMTKDAPASRILWDSPDKWPTPVLTSPWGIGTHIRRGEELKSLPQDNPLRRSYFLYKGGEGKNWDHPVYDQAAVHYAVRGFDGGPAADYYELIGPGWYRIDDTADPDHRHGFVGFTGFDLDPNGLHTQKDTNVETFDQEMIGDEIVELMMHNPYGRNP